MMAMEMAATVTLSTFKMMIIIKIVIGIVIQCALEAAPNLQ